MGEKKMANSAVEKLTEKRQKLEQRLKDIRAAEEAEKNKRLIVAGEAVLREAEKNPEFKRQLDQVLARQLKGKRSRSLFGLDPEAASSEPGGAHTA